MNGFTFDHFTLEGTDIYSCSYIPFQPEDYMQYLTSEENERMLGFKHVNRRREFVATRILRHRVFGYSHIHYDINGAPFIEDLGYISISHSKDRVALGVNTDFKIGLDLEAPRENIMALKHKFVTHEEAECFNVDDPLEVTKMWSAKEVLYKLAGRKKIVFKRDLLLSKDAEGNWLGKIVNDDHYRFVKLGIFEYQDIYLSINTEPIVEKSRHL